MLAQRLSPSAWARTQTPMALFVVRLLLVANSAILGAVGLLCLLFVSRPAGLVGAALVWGLAATFVSLIRYTNPHRGETSRW